MNEAETEADHIDTALKAAGRADRTSDGPIRPHSGLGYRPPAPEAWQPSAFAWRTPQQTHWAGLLEVETLT